MSITIQAAFARVSQALQPLYETREAQNIAHMILEHITGFSKLDRILHKDQSLPPEQEQALDAATTALLQGQPVHYVTGRSWFYGMEFIVNEQVLIPRPETEELVEWIVKEVKAAGSKEVRMIDIGTGSGCIPIALKKELPLATIHAIDISAGALDIARENAHRLGTSIHFYLLNALDTAATQALPTFDIIVSNPPYILEEEKAGMMPQVVNFEPSLALFVPNDDALLFYRAIGILARQKLVSGGKLFFEINEAKGPETLELLTTLGFSRVTLKQDIFGKDRMILAIKN
ncbi:release factor glutamine methyltransferase [Chitinophaga costaii]|uniref:Release factor glutamine methyltransferase n=1 Tax=Chitinophaga costaii TaxID=1335309 RepID=A0A1C4D4U9_9BACT|nr:peptide chain release factor N(5)-glutamine methyltransferase [Chitinophaga costaii]PUZ24456.1 peptide chain release factor N(5)-glutamine methyltransferase [Chitinophaga costaii]SCC26342.1 release factor glutamine methyltransferase [Chitinophaga costaii]